MNYNFKDVEKDIERWLEKHGTQELLPGGQICVRGYDKAKKEVVEAYFEADAYEELLAFALKGYRDLPFITKLTTALLKTKDCRRLKRLWEAIVAEAKLSYWQSLSVDTFFATEENGQRITKEEEVEKRHAEITLPRLKREVLETMRRYESILAELGDQQTTLSRLGEDIQFLESGKKRKLTSKPQKRNIDETVFWELVDQLQAFESVEEKSIQLVTLLESFSAADIKRFQKLLVEKMQLANHFDIWALAYLAQDGCSDDAFESFRAWLILQGNSRFQSTVENINLVSDAIPAGLETAADQLLWCAAIAYENRSGLPLIIKAGKTITAGKPWQETDLESLYPILWKRYRQKL